MKRICPECHFIGLGRHKGSLILGSAVIGLAIIMYGLMYQESVILSALMSIIILTIGAIGIRNYYKIDGDICPVCKYPSMPLINDQKGQQIINDNKLTIEDTVTFTCNSCDYKGLGYKTHSFKLSIIIILFGLLFSVYGLLIDQAIVLFGSIVIIGSGIYGISTNYTNQNKCPSCKNNTLIPIESRDQTKASTT